MKKSVWIVIILLVLIFFFGSIFFFLGGVFYLFGDGASYVSGNVAVIKVEGGILDPEDILKEIRRFRKNDEVKAVVIRLNSPGGTMGASQEIYSEVRRLREKKKVVASMGTVAASGAYYIACGAEKIFANPGTITGSIGVLMEHMNVEELFHWAKMRPEILKSGDMKDVASPIRPMTPEEREFLESILSQLHAQFKAAVAEERGLLPEEVEKLADGRIFTGEEAKKVGLIDSMGTLEDAITAAAEMAGIKGEPEVIYPREKGGWLKRFIDEEASVFANRFLKSNVMGEIK